MTDQAPAERPVTYYTVKEAAEILRCDEQTVLARAVELGARRFGRVLIPTSAVDSLPLYEGPAWLRKQADDTESVA